MQTVAPFCTALQKQRKFFPGLFGCRSFFWRLLCTIDVTVPDIANVFQIWSTLAGYEEIAVLREPITNVEITSMYNNEQLLDDVIVKVLV